MVTRGRSRRDSLAEQLTPSFRTADPSLVGVLPENTFAAIIASATGVDIANVHELIRSSSCRDGRGNVKYDDFCMWLNIEDNPGLDEALAAAIKLMRETSSGARDGDLERAISAEDVEMTMTEQMQVEAIASFTISPGENGTTKLKAKHGLATNQVMTQRDRKLYMMKVYRISIPASRQNKPLGPDGLNLRQQFLMHAVAIESVGRKFSFDVSPETILTAGQFLWFGFEGTFGFDQESRDAVVPQECVSRLIEFMAEEVHLDKDIFEYGHLPVFEADIPAHLNGLQLKSAKIRKTSGARVLALGRALEKVTCFPSPETILNCEDKIYVTFEIRELLQKLQVSP